MKLLTAAQHAALLEVIMQYGGKPYAPVIGTPIKDIRIELDDFDTESDEPFTYTKERIVIEGSEDGTIVVEIVQDLYSIDCDGDLIASRVLDTIFITHPYGAIIEN
jgi:hypothetical protein